MKSRKYGKRGKRRFHGRRLKRRHARRGKRSRGTKAFKKKVEKVVRSTELVKFLDWHRYISSDAGEGFDGASNRCIALFTQADLLAFNDFHYGYWPDPFQNNADLD